MLNTCSRILHKPVSQLQGVKLCFSLLFFLSFLTVGAVERGSLTIDPITINGKVLDETGQPLVGVSVLLKGTSIKTQTNSEGGYTIKVPEQSGVLVFSYIGYIKKEVEIKHAGAINVTLQPESSKLDDVVVVGYGTVKRPDITGSVGSVNMKDLAKAPVTNFTDALAGRVAGVQVNSNDGQPGNVSNIVIRGANSLTQSNAPLYVVDGFPMEDVDANNISSADIANIDILKDASATAIYGARGANGVVVITTKKGKSGRPIFSFNSYVGMQNNPKRVKLLDAYEYVKLMLEVNPSTNTPRYLNSNFPTLESYRNATTIDLQDELFRTALYQNYDISLRGGNENTQYSISGNRLDQNGIIINSGFKRWQGRFDLDQKINNSIKAGLNVNYGYSKSYGTPINNPNLPAALNNSNGTTGVLGTVWSYRPTRGKNYDLESIADELFDTSNGADGSLINPIIEANNLLRETLSHNLNINAYTRINIAKNLTFKTTFGINDTKKQNNRFYNSNTFYGRDTIPGRANLGNGVSGSIVYNNKTSITNENTLNYKLNLNDTHHFDMLAGITFQRTKESERGLAATHIPRENEFMGLDALGTAPRLWSPTDASYSVISNSGINILNSYLARVNYDYKSKYLLTASFRADGSSKFAKGHRWGYFPSGSLAWKITGEDFMKGIPQVSEAKIRVGYGVTGNNRIGDFDYLPRLDASALRGYTYNNLAGASGVTIGSIGNADLRWETTAMANVGLDLGLFKQRVVVTADWYKKNTNDLLLNANVPSTLGVSSAIKNVGKMQNTGLELSLTSTNIDTKSFFWSSTFNIAFNQNKLVELTEGASFLTLPANTLGAIGSTNAYSAISPYISVVGQPVGQMYGVIFDGLYQYSDFDKMPNGSYALKAGMPFYGSSATIQPGWAKYKDLNGDGTINAQDYTIIGRGLPIHIGGFSNNFSYHNFDLNIFLQWSYGNNIVNANRIIFESPAEVTSRNLYATMANRWSPTNQNTDIPVGIATNYLGYNSRVIEDGSFLRLKTISLGYNVSPSVLKKISLSALRVYATAQNIHTWTNYSGTDPEVSTRNTVQSPGFDYTAYPLPKTLVFGISANF